jgi:hypothetical protein
MTARARFLSALAPVAILALGVAAPAHAETVVATPPLSVGAGTSLQCRIVNLGTRPIAASVAAIDTSGHPIFAEDVIVPARAVQTVGQLSIGTLNAYCRFAGAFSKALVRASIENYNGSEAKSLLIVPAQ